MYPQYVTPYYMPSQPQIQANNGQTQSNTPSGGFMSVNNEEEAYNYPVAHGNSMCFRNDTAPYVYIKSVGFSPLDRPVFERYKKEEVETTEQVTEDKDNTILDELRDEIATLRDDMETLKAKIKTLPKMPVKKVLKEVIDDEE